MDSLPEDRNGMECTEAEVEEREVDDEDEDELTEDESIDDEFDRRAFGIYRQLPVKSGTPDFSAGPPETAEEYLRRVR